ncbi:tyrosine-type recombinase/integrase [Clostridium faecium]
MKGSVKKRGSTWSYIFDLGKIDGKRKQKTKGGFKTKKEASEALNEAMYRYKTGFIEPKKMYFDDYMNNYLENSIKINRKINTYFRYKELYEKYIKNHIGFLAVSEIRPLHIENILIEAKKTGISGSTLQSIYGVINSSLNKALKLQIINNNPCTYVERPKREKFEANTLTIDEINKLYKALDTAEEGDYIIGLALRIILELGLRRGELGGLEWKNIDLENKTINITNNLVYTNNNVILTTTKTSESIRTILISDELVSVLKAHRKQQLSDRLRYGEFYIENYFNNIKYDFIMTWENGKYVHPNYYTLKFKKILNKIGIDRNIRFHDLRHTNATLLLQCGINFKVIQRRLGHADINTTMNIYSHVDIKMQEDATEKISKLIGEK